MQTIKNSPALSILAKTSPNDTPKLFIGGLDVDTQLETIEKYFSQFGELADCVIKPDRNSDGKQNYGFVTYKQPHTAHFVSTLKHVIDQRRIDCKKARLKDNPVDTFANDPDFKTSKIFVGGLPLDLEVEEMKNYFGRFGQVVDCVIIPNRETNRSRCFGFVQFTTCKAVEDVILNYYRIKIKEKWVECKKAIPKEACLELQRNGDKYTRMLKDNRGVNKENYQNRGNFIRNQVVQSNTKIEIQNPPVMKGEEEIKCAPSFFNNNLYKKEYENESQIEKSAAPMQLKVENKSRKMSENKLEFNEQNLDRVSKEIANTLLGNEIFDKNNDQSGLGKLKVEDTQKKEFCPY